MYQPLAMKLNHGWMRHYDIFNYYLEKGQTPGTVDYLWTEDPARMSARTTRQIYHLPLHVQPPLMAHLIWLSHGLLRHGEPYTSASQHLGRAVLTNPPWALAKAQFYALIVPVSFALATLLLVHLFCLRFYTWREGVLACLLLAASPVDIAFSARIYADSVAVGLGFASLVLFLFNLQRPGRSAAWAGLAGVLLGLAYLAKTVAVVYASGMLFAALLMPTGRAGLVRKVFDPRLIAAALGAFLITLPWNWLVYKTYGSVSLPAPYDPANSWHGWVFQRPWFAYWLGMIAFLPPMALGWLYGLFALIRARSYRLELVLFLTALSFFLALALLLKTHKAGLEHRYFLPVYPLVAILSARAVLQIVAKLAPSRAQGWVFALSFLALAAGGYHWAQLGWDSLFRGYLEFKPLGW